MAVVLYSFSLVFLYRCVSFACLATMNFMIVKNCTVVTAHTNLQELYLICSTNLLPMNAHSNNSDLPCKAGGSTTLYIAICIMYLLRIHTADLQHTHYLNFIGIAIDNYFKTVLYQNIIFSTSLRLLYCYTVCTLRSWRMLLMYRDVRQQICCCLMMFSFYMYHYGLIMAQLRAGTGCCLINIFIKVCGLWLEIC